MGTESGVRRERRRVGPGHSPATGAAAAHGLGALRRVAGTRTNQLLLTGIVIGTVPWAMLLVYMNDYFVQEKGFTVPEATGIMAAFGVATLARTPRSGASRTRRSGSPCCSPRPPAF